MKKMDFQEILNLVEEVPGGTYGLLVGFVVGLIGVVVLCFALIGGGSSAGKTSDKEKSEAEEEVVSITKQAKNRGSRSKQQPSRKVTLPSHPLLAADFKGHTGAVFSLDFDSNGKYLASCSEDRTIRLWHMKTLQDKDHKYTRKSIELDHASHIKFSPDGRAVIVTLSVSNTIHVYGIMKGSTTNLSDTIVEFPKVSSSSVLSLGIASTGKFIMTYTTDSFTIWTLKGEELATVSTLQSPNTCAQVSPCGKFVACAGFTSDVKLWEVEFTKSGDYQKVSKAMDLKGHHASVHALGFSGDSRRMASASKDGTWKYWDIDVQYRLSEDPKLLMTGKIPLPPEDTCLSLSPDSRVVAISVNFSIYIYSTATGNLLESLDNIHKDKIRDLCWDPCSLYLVSAGGEDRYIRVWHNAPGMKELLVDLEGKLPKATSEPQKRRIREQIKETRSRLNSLGL